MRQTARLCTAVAVLLLSGCVTKPPPVRHSIFAGIDLTSSNTANQRSSYIQKLAGLADEQRNDTWADIQAFGISSETLYAERFNGADDLNGALATYQSLPAPKKRGTYWAPLLDKFLYEIPFAQGNASIVIFTDGECYDPESCYALATRLAALPNLKAVLIGPVIHRDDIRNRLEDAFRPLGNRVIIASDDDYPSSYQRFKEMY